MFRTLKTQGCDIEGLLIEDEAPVRNLVMATLIAAVSIQQLVHARDGQTSPGPLRPLTDAFEAEDQPLLEAFCAKLQGKTLRQKNPHPAGSLAYGAWVCARLGGWTGYYGKPGPTVMLHGWLYFQAAKHGTTLGAAYIQPLSDDFEVVLRADAQFRAKGQFALDPTITQPAYQLLDLGATLRPTGGDRRWTLGVSVSNVFDKERYFFEFEAPAQTGTRIGFVAPPRRAVFKFTYDF